MHDQHLDREYLEVQLRLKSYILQALENFSDLFRQVESALRERGEYFRANTGQFYFGLTNIDFEREVGTERSEEEVMKKTEEIFNLVRAQVLQLLGEASSSRTVEPIPLKEFLGRRAIA